MSSYLKYQDDCKLYFFFGIFSKSDLSFIKPVIDYCCVHLKLSSVCPRDDVLTRLARILRIYENVRNPKNKRHNKFR
jgi:hypothetical protein